MRNIRAGLMIALVLAGAMSVADAGPLDDASSAYQQGDYATVLRLVGPMADQGDARALTYLGILYENGLGVPRNYAEAVKWYSRAADQGDARAQTYLGILYQNGLGVPRDYAEAVKWYSRAAYQGDARAQTYLGTLYENGLGVPQDYAEAVKLYRMAAEQGDAIAQLNLGILYENGLGVPRDYAEAAKWHHKAADQGYDILASSTFRKNDEVSKKLALGGKLEAFPKGDIFLDAPKAMKVGDKRHVDANVGINVPMEVLRKKSHAGDQQFEGQARVSSEMIATLSGPGFQIDALTPGQQAIAEGFPTVWSWKVEAKDPGDQELEVALYALVQNGETILRQRVNRYTQTISVSVREQTWGEWLESLTHGIDTVKAVVVTLSGIATVVLGWFGISLTRQNKKGDGTSSTKDTS